MKSRILNLSETVKSNIIQFALIFISVFLAFSLSEWSKSRDNKASKKVILSEIKNGLQLDLIDFNNNISYYKKKQKSIIIFRNWVNNKPQIIDSLDFNYTVLLRNFTPIFNKTGYESIRGNNISLISNADLRHKIIKNYEYYYKILEILEFYNAEGKTFENYFQKTNDLFHPYFVFNEKGVLIALETPNQLTENQRKELLSYFLRIEKYTYFKLKRYDEIIKNIEVLIMEIEKEIE
jgi:hypothetical protein